MTRNRTEVEQPRALWWPTDETRAEKASLARFLWGPWLDKATHKQMTGRNLSKHPARAASPYRWPMAAWSASLTPTSPSVPVCRALIGRWVGTGVYPFCPPVRPPA